MSNLICWVIWACFQYLTCCKIYLAKRTECNMSTVFFLILAACHPRVSSVFSLCQCSPSFSFVSFLFFLYVPVSFLLLFFLFPFAFPIPVVTLLVMRASSAGPAFFPVSTPVSIAGVCSQKFWQKPCLQKNHCWPFLARRFETREGFASFPWCHAKSKITGCQAHLSLEERRYPNLPHYLPFPHYFSSCQPRKTRKSQQWFQALQRTKETDTR